MRAYAQSKLANLVFTTELETIKAGFTLRCSFGGGSSRHGRVKHC